MSQHTAQGAKKRSGNATSISISSSVTVSSGTSSSSAKLTTFSGKPSSVSSQPVAMHAVDCAGAPDRHAQRGPAADGLLAFGHRRAAFLQRMNVAQQLADVRPVDPVAAAVAHERIGRRQRQRGHARRTDATAPCRRRDRTRAPRRDAATRNPSGRSPVSGTRNGFRCARRCVRTSGSSRDTSGRGRNAPAQRSRDRRSCSLYQARGQQRGDHGAASTSSTPSIPRSRWLLKTAADACNSGEPARLRRREPKRLRRRAEFGAHRDAACGASISKPVCGRPADTVSSTGTCARTITWFGRKK